MFSGFLPLSAKMKEDSLSMVSKWKKHAAFCLNNRFPDEKNRRSSIGYTGPFRTYFRQVAGVNYIERLENNYLTLMDKIYL